MNLVVMHGDEWPVAWSSMAMSACVVMHGDEWAVANEDSTCVDPGGGEAARTSAVRGAGRRGGGLSPYAYSDADGEASPVEYRAEGQHDLVIHDHREGAEEDRLREAEGVQPVASGGH